MFIAGNPKLVIEQCKAGIVGSFPALNARPKETLDAWLTRSSRTRRWRGAARTRAPVRGEPDRAQVERPPRARRRGLRPAQGADHDHQPARAGRGGAAIHAYGGIVLHDVINVRHAREGAGGRRRRPDPGLRRAPAAMPARCRRSRWCGEVRRFFDGPIVLSGAIASGDAILAAQADGRRPRLHRHALPRHAARRACPSATRRRSSSGRRGHRLHGPVLRRARQLPEAQRGRGRLRSAQPARSPTRRR